MLINISKTCCRAWLWVAYHWALLNWSLFFSVPQSYTKLIPFSTHCLYKIFNGLSPGIFYEKKQCYQLNVPWGSLAFQKAGTHYRRHNNVSLFMLLEHYVHLVESIWYRSLCCDCFFFPLHCFHVWLSVIRLVCSVSTRLSNTKLCDFVRLWWVSKSRPALQQSFCQTNQVSIIFSVIWSRRKPVHVYQ